MHGCTTTTLLDPFFLMERRSNNNNMSSSLRKQQRRDDEEEVEDDLIDTSPPTTKKTNNNNSVSGSRSRSCSSISDDISFSDLSTKDDDTSSRMSVRRERRIDGGGTVKSFDSLMDRTSSSLDKSILSSNSGININNESSDEEEDFGPGPGGWSNYVDETGEEDMPNKELDYQQDDHDNIGDNGDEPYFETLKTGTSRVRNEGTKSLHDSCPVNFLGETNDFQEEKKQQQQDGGLSISSHGYTNIQQLSSPIGVILHSPKSGPSTRQYRKGQHIVSPRIQERIEILKSQQRSQSPRPIRVPLNTSPKVAQRRKSFNPKVGISSSSAHSRTNTSGVGLGSSSAHGVMIRNNNSSLANTLEQNPRMRRKGFDRSSCSLDGLPFSRQQRDHTTTKASTHHRYQNSHDNNDLGDSKRSFFSFSSCDNISLASDMERRHRPQQQQQQQQLEDFSDDDFEQADKHRFDENDDNEEEESIDLSGIVARGGRDAVSGGGSDGERRRDSWGQMVNSLKSPPQKSPRSTAGVNRTDDDGAATSSSVAFPAPPFWIDNDDDESDRNHDMTQNPPSFRRHHSTPVPSSWVQGSHGGHQKEALEADPFLAEDKEDQETVENLKLKIQELERKLESSGRTGEMDLNDCPTSNRPSSREKDLTELLNAKDKRIKELEEQLARANANAHPTEYFGGNDSFFNLPSMSCSSDDNDEDSEAGRKERGRKVKRRGSTGVMSDKRRLLRDGGKRSGTPIRPRSAGSMGQLSDAKSSRRGVGGLKENGTSMRPRRAGSLGQLADAKSSRRSVGGLKENGTLMQPIRADSLGKLAGIKPNRSSTGSLKEKSKKERQIGSDDNDDDKKADKKMKRRKSTGAMDDKIKTKRKASADRKQSSKEKKPDAEGDIGTMDLADDSSKSSKKSMKRSSSANSLARKKREKARGRSPSSKSLRQSRTIQMPMDEYEKGMKRTNSNNSLKGVSRTSSHSSQTSKKKEERRSQSPRSLSQRLSRTIGLAIENDDDDNQSNASSKSSRRRSSKGGPGIFKKSDKSKVEDASASSVGSSSHKSSKSAKTAKTDLSTFLNNRDNEAAIRVTRRSKKLESDSTSSAPEKSGKKVKKANKKVGDDNLSVSGGSVTGQKRKKRLGGIKKWSSAMDFDLMKAGSSPKPQKKDP